MGECIAEEGPSVTRERQENAGAGGNCANAEHVREAACAKTSDSTSSVNAPAGGSIYSSSRVTGSLLHEGPKLKGAPTNLNTALSMSSLSRRMLIR